jgi:hypothetical protein
MAEVEVGWLANLPPLGTGILAVAAMSLRDTTICGDGCKVAPAVGADVAIPILGLVGPLLGPPAGLSACLETNMPIEPSFFFAVGIILSRIDRP